MFKANALELGKLAEIHGLQSKPEKNGLIGRLIGFNDQSGRWIVRIQNRDEELSVKPENLWAVTECGISETEVPPVFESKSLLDLGRNGGARNGMRFEATDVGHLSEGISNTSPIPLDAFCCYELSDNGRKAGSMGLIPRTKNGGKFDFPDGLQPTGHGLLMRGLVSKPSPLGYIEGVKLYHEPQNKFVAVSNIHRQVILILCGPDGLAALEQCKKLTISAWITTGASIHPVIQPLHTIGLLHDWTEIEHEQLAGRTRAAYYEDPSGRYYLRAPLHAIGGGVIVTDDNTEALTAADDVSKVDPAIIIEYGPVPVDWAARGAPPSPDRTGPHYSDDPADLKITALQEKMRAVDPERLRGALKLREQEVRARAVAEAVAAAEAGGEGEALYQEGLRLEFEEGDVAGGVARFRRAAELGHAAAIGKLGRALLVGEGAERDVEEGVRQTRRAAEMGDPMSQCNMASCYIQGLIGDGLDGSGQSPAEVAAVGWYRRAAAQGFGAAQWNLGVFVLEGLGGETEDGPAALALFRSAADQDEGGGHFQLARLYEQGRAVPQDLDRALHHYQEAAALGFAPAQRALRSGARRL